MNPMLISTEYEEVAWGLVGLTQLARHVTCTAYRREGFRVQACPDPFKHNKLDSASFALETEGITHGRGLVPIADPSRCRYSSYASQRTNAARE